MHLLVPVSIPAWFASVEQAAHTPDKEETVPMHPSIPKPTPSLGERALDVVVNDGAEAAWRVAGKQLVKLVRDPLAAAIARHLAPDDDSMRGKVAEFLHTDLGEGLLAGLLAAGLAALPGANADVTDRLARELRVRALSEAGDTLVDLLAEPLREALKGVIAGGHLQVVGALPSGTDQVRLGGAGAVSWEALAGQGKAGG